MRAALLAFALSACGGMVEASPEGTFDTSKPSEARRVCWRADVGDPCPCRSLTPGETAYAEVAP